MNIIDNPNGWKKENTYSEVDKIRVTMQLPDYITDASFINEKLVTDLIKKDLSTHLVDNKHFRWSTYNSYETFSKVVRYEATIVPSDIKYVNKKEDIFIVDGQEFTEQELIDAVNHHFAERFI